MPSLRIKIGNVSILILLATPTKLLLLRVRFFPDCIAWPACWPAYPAGQCASHARVLPLLWACRTPCRNPHSAQWSARPHLSSIPVLRRHHRPCQSSVRLQHGCQTPPPLSEIEYPQTACVHLCGPHPKARRCFPAASARL